MIFYVYFFKNRYGSPPRFDHFARSINDVTAEKASKFGYLERFSLNSAVRSLNLRLFEFFCSKNWKTNWKMKVDTYGRIEYGDAKSVRKLLHHRGDYSKSAPNCRASVLRRPSDPNIVRFTLPILSKTFIVRTSTFRTLSLVMGDRFVFDTQVSLSVDFF
jgi:hypothetical protein